MLVAALLLAGCTDSTSDAPSLVVHGSPVASPYASSLTVPMTERGGADVAERTGAAARALECDGPVGNGAPGDYGSGLEAVGAGPEDALRLFLGAAFSAAIPPHGYRVEAQRDDRALLSYDVDGRTKVALVTAPDMRDERGGRGWGVLAWAHCDPAEWPADVTEALDIGVWQDRSGARVPTSTVSSWQGRPGGHCEWQSIPSLHLGRAFFRDVDGVLARHVFGSFEASAALPRDATDTGYRRAGQVLWLSAARDGAYLVSEDDPADVERWPGARRPLLCG